MECKKSKQNPIVSGWYHQFHRQLTGFLSKGVRSEVDVQDISQEVFLRLLRVKQPELVESPKAYLYRVAIHVLDEWRMRERRLHPDLPEQSSEFTARHNTTDINSASHFIENSMQNPVHDEQQNQQIIEVRQALDKLPPNYASALILRWHHGMNYTEIARKLEVTERMVKRYIVKGYAELRICIEQGEGRNE